METIYKDWLIESAKFKKIPKEDDNVCENDSKKRCSSSKIRLFNSLEIDWEKYGIFKHISQAFITSHVSNNFDTGFSHSSKNHFKARSPRATIVIAYLMESEPSAYTNKIYIEVYLSIQFYKDLWLILRILISILQFIIVWTKCSGMKKIFVEWLNLFSY